VPYLEPDAGHPVLYFEEAGHGRPLVLVHGWATTSQIWDPVVGELSRYFRVITFDLRGHGRSEVLNIRHDIECFASDIHTVFSQLKLTDAVLLGWDLGAQASILYAARGGWGVTQLVLLSTMPFYLDISPRKTNWNKEFLAELGELTALPRPVFLKKYLSMYFAEPPAEEVLDWLVRMGLDTPAWVAAECSASQFSTDLRQAVSSLGVPTMVVHGRRDRICTFEGAEALLEAIPRAQLEPFDNSGHLPHLEERKHFVDAVVAFSAGPLVATS
jgi:non-heme chloroperoxidase